MHKKNPYKYHGFRSKCRGFPLFFAVVEMVGIDDTHLCGDVYDTFPQLFSHFANTKLSLCPTVYKMHKNKYDLFMTTPQALGVSVPLRTASYGSMYQGSVGWTYAQAYETPPRWTHPWIRAETHGSDGDRVS